MQTNEQEQRIRALIVGGITPRVIETASAVPNGYRDLAESHDLETKTITALALRWGIRRKGRTNG
jgi:hypothetical protein